MKHDDFIEVNIKIFKPSIKMYGALILSDMENEFKAPDVLPVGWLLDTSKCTECNAITVTTIRPAVKPLKPGKGKND